VWWVGLGVVWGCRWAQRRPAPALAAGLAGLSTWFHPLAGLFFVVAALFMVVSELLRARRLDAPSVRRAFAVSAAMAISMVVFIAWPLAHDLASLSSKGGKDMAGPATIFRAASLFAGSRYDLVNVTLYALCAAGALVLWRRDRPLAAYLLVLVAGPSALVVMLSPQWSQQGHTFARYVFPAQVILLGLASVGAATLIRVLARVIRVPGVVWGSCLAVAIAYIAVTPTVSQVTTLGPWYAHVINTYDYDPAWNRALDQYRGYEPPGFYLGLGKLPPGEAPIIEAPFSAAAPDNPFAWFARFHRQPEKMGMLHALCIPGPLDGEVPAHDPRFRLRQFVALEDREATLATGARYLLLYKGNYRGRPFVEAKACEEALAKLYGDPMLSDARLAVFDLERSRRSAL
jgi:hypothetical protein